MFKIRFLSISFIVIALVILWAEYQNSRPPEGLASVLRGADDIALTGSFDPTSEAGKSLRAAGQQLSTIMRSKDHALHAKVQSIRRHSSVSFRNQHLSTGWNASVRLVRGGIGVRAPSGPAYTITIYDGVGNVLKSKVVVKGGYAVMLTENLPRGMYFVTVASEQKKVVTRIALSPQ